MLISRLIETLRGGESERTKIEREVGSLLPTTTSQEFSKNPDQIKQALIRLAPRQKVHSRRPRSPTASTTSTCSMTSTRGYIDFAAGNKAQYDQELSQYHDLVKWLVQTGGKYGLATDLSELETTGRETLTAMYQAETKVSYFVIAQENRAHSVCYRSA